MSYKPKEKIVTPFLAQAETKDDNSAVTTKSAPVVEKPALSTGVPSTTSTVVRKKYEMCKNFKEKGVCKYGDKCLFAHGDHELTRRGSPSEAEKKPTEVKKEAASTIVQAKDNSRTAQDQTTLDSTKIIDLTNEKGEPDVSVLTEQELRQSEKKLSSESEHFSNEATLNDEIVLDQGENSTTLSSINDNSSKNTPEKTSTKLSKVSNRADHSFYSFKKEEEFKELLENLDIGNINLNCQASEKQEKAVQEIQQ